MYQKIQKEEVAHMEAREDSNKIVSLLKLKGYERLMVSDDITAGIHATVSKLAGKTCIKLAFLNTQKKEAWTEYSLLLEIPKVDEHIKYLGYEFEELGRFLKELEETIDYDKSGINSIGIDQVETRLPNSYFILLYILRDDR